MHYSIHSPVPELDNFHAERHHRGLCNQEFRSRIYVQNQAAFSLFDRNNILESFCDVAVPTFLPALNGKYSYRDYRCALAVHHYRFMQ